MEGTILLKYRPENNFESSKTLKLITKMLKLFAALSSTLKLLHNYFNGL